MTWAFFVPEGGTVTMTMRGTQRINEAGNLEIGGCDTVDLTREFGTPLYVVDEAQMRGVCQEYLKHFRARYPHVTVEYAGKALLAKAICAIIESEELHARVRSIVFELIGKGEALS